MSRHDPWGPDGPPNAKPPVLKPIDADATISRLPGDPDPMAGPDGRFEPDEARFEKIKGRRDAAGWYAVAGTGLLFVSGVSTALAVGGVAMILYGAGGYAYWAKRMPKRSDPWKDPELDAWEKEHF